MHSMDISSSVGLLRCLKRKYPPQSAPADWAAGPANWPMAQRNLAMIEAFHKNHLSGTVTVECLCEIMSDLLREQSETCLWELAALVTLLLKEAVGFIQQDQFTLLGELAAFARSHVTEAFLSHEEPRVRKLNADLIGVLAERCGPAYYDEMAPVLFRLISNYFERRETSRQTQLGSESEIALDDTTGWFALESLLRSHSELVRGVGPALRYLDRISAEELDLYVSRSANHMNRHIRQATYEFIHMLMMQLEPCSISWQDGPHVSLLCSCVAAGLADDFSQVRFAATFAARYFLIAINDADRETFVWATMLPRLCLNRHYPADGVKSASLDTWAELSRGRGRELVAKFVDEAYEYYRAMTENKSHLVCEAACWVIGELGSVMPLEVVRPHLPGLLEVLGVCLGDDSWQVRDAACVATGRFVQAHPLETCQVARTTYLPLYILHLSDHILALRVDSAAALGSLLRSPEKSLASEALSLSVAYIAENLMAAKAPRKKISFIPESSSLYAFVKNKPDDDFAVPLPPPVPGDTQRVQKRFGPTELRRRPGSWGCCMDCSSSGVERKRWQRSEGAVYLLREVVSVAPSTQTLRFLEQAVSLLRYSESPEYLKLHDSIWQQLPDLISIMGKEAAVRVATELVQLYSECHPGKGVPNVDKPLPQASLGPPPGAVVFTDRISEELKKNTLVALGRVLGRDEMLSMCASGVQRERIDSIISHPGTISVRREEL